MRPLDDRDRDALALTRRRLRRVLEGLPSSTGLALEMTCVVPHWLRRIDEMIGPEVAAVEDFDAGLPEPMEFHEIDFANQGSGWPEDCGVSDPELGPAHHAREC